MDDYYDDLDTRCWLFGDDTDCADPLTGKTANDACCICGGGVSAVNAPFTSPPVAPVTSPPVTSAPTRSPRVPTTKSPSYGGKGGKGHTNCSEPSSTRDLKKSKSSNGKGGKGGKGGSKKSHGKGGKGGKGKCPDDDVITTTMDGSNTGVTVQVQPTDTNTLYQNVRDAPDGAVFVTTSGVVGNFASFGVNNITCVGGLASMMVTLVMLGIIL